MMAAFLMHPSSASVNVAIGAVALGLAALCASMAAAGRMGTSPGRRALIHWLPIAVAVLLARALGSWEIAIGLIFGTSVAVMSTVLGSVSTVAPVGPAPANWKRLWPFTLAAAMIVFISGFNGLLNWKHGIALIVEGIALLSLWQDSAGEHEWVEPTGLRAQDLAPAGLEWGSMFACVVFAMAGAYAATLGAGGVQQGRFHLSGGTVSATLLSLVLAGPMAQGDRRLAAAGASWVAATAQFGVVLLNLCVLFPIMALVPYATAFARFVRGSHHSALDWSAYAPQLTAFPLAVWRIDAVVLVILSLIVLPVAMGKWNLAREEGVVLIVGYCIYLTAVTVAGIAPP